LFLKLRDEIMSVNPQCLDYGSEDCRSVLNVAAGTTVGTDRHANDDAWMTVESKKERRAKRLKSCMNTGKTQSVSHVNGKKSGKRVKFDDSRDTLILL
jgi:hypothetical protein